MPSKSSSASRPYRRAHSAAAGAPNSSLIEFALTDAPPRSSRSTRDFFTRDFSSSFSDCGNGSNR